MPLVVADQPDEEALVVLPLRLYEELCKEGELKPFPQSVSARKATPPSTSSQEPIIHVPIENKDQRPSLKDVIEVPVTPLDEGGAEEEPSIPLFERRPSSSPNLFSAVPSEEGKGGDLELEERFYLEPVDDGENSA